MLRSRYWKDLKSVNLKSDQSEFALLVTFSAVASVFGGMIFYNCVFRTPNVTSFANGLNGVYYSPYYYMLYRRQLAMFEF